MKQIIFSLILIFFLSGCGQHIAPFQSAHRGTKQVYLTNYTLGEKSEAFIGEPMVKVKDYSVDAYSSRHMRATHDFQILEGPGKIIGMKDIDLNATEHGQHCIMP